MLFYLFFHKITSLVQSTSETYHMKTLCSNPRLFSFLVSKISFMDIVMFISLTHTQNARLFGIVYSEKGN